MNHFQGDLYGDFLRIWISFGFLVLLAVAVLFDVVFFGGNDFVVAVVVAVVVCFECVHFAVLAPGINAAAVHTLFADCVLAVVEIVIVVADLR